MTDLTEEQCVQHLPLIKDWEPGLRARFIEGMGLLNGRSCPEPDLAVLIGMIVLCCEEHEPQVWIRLKTDCAEIARANGVDEEMIAAILSPAIPGHLDVFVHSGQHDLVFAIPLAASEFHFVGTKH